MNTPDPLTELRNYVAGQVVASEKAIEAVNRLHDETEILRRSIVELRENYCPNQPVQMGDECDCFACTVAKRVLR